jgi:hypothetical protein
LKRQNARSFVRLYYSPQMQGISHRIDRKGENH